MPRRFGLLVLAVSFVLLAVPACGDDDDSATGDDGGASATSTTATGDTTVTTAAGPPSGSEEKGGTTAPPVAGVPTTAKPAPPPTSGAPLQPSAIEPTKPGKYTYDQTGTTKIRGCFVADQPAPTPVTLQVDPPSGNRQQTTRDEGGGNRQIAVLEFRPDGIYLAYLRQEQPQIGTFEFEPNPPVLAAPASPTVGQTWSFTLTSKDGKIKAEVSNRVETIGEQVALGDGTKVAAARALSEAHITGQAALGPVDLRTTGRGFASRDVRLIVKEITDTKGTIGLCQVESHTEGLLKSATPA